MRSQHSPAQIEMMRLAYKRAREQHPHLPDIEIAQRIFSAAYRGEDDPERLYLAGVGLVGLSGELLHPRLAPRRDEEA